MSIDGKRIRRRRHNRSNRSWMWKAVLVLAVVYALVRAWDMWGTAIG